MDLRHYFVKLREMEAIIQEEYPVVVSLETGDGGKAGVLSEVSRENAARLVVENRAILAKPEEAQGFREAQQEIRRSAHEAQFANQVQLAIVSDPELQAHFAQKKSSSSPTNRK